jgi:cytochrome c5
MVDVHPPARSTLIQTPQQLIVAVAAGFLVTVVGILLLVQLITGGLKVDMKSPAMTEEAVAERLKPVGEVVIGQGPAPAAAPAPVGPGTTAAKPAGMPAPSVGEKLYNAVCQACHASGLAGAPRTGDPAAWKARIAQGTATLHEHAIKGIRAMPPKGGAMSASDAEIRAAVDYMVGKSK